MYYMVNPYKFNVGKKNSDTNCETECNITYFKYVEISFM